MTDSRYQLRPASRSGPPAVAPPRTVVLIGLMGAGKTSIGRRLATRLGLPFRDADHEIEAAAGCTIPEFFARYGEAEFRAGERRVIARLLTEEPVHVLATGGGAYMDPQTRELIRDHGISIWLKAELDVLVARTGRRNNRPLLRQGNPKDILARLIETRYPVYAGADVTVATDDAPLAESTGRVLAALKAYLARQPEGTR
ncbi:shikimate kinase [Arenibaculum sp.]|uniref:shikimate kinase n=1 Tax=Arenibaculum sp. TaxID=2865862 RepID=UPI002E111C07|nr:shikimate kinase [Arenibaculum sp.]